MPWCETCDRFLSPSTVQTDGSCPACGHPVSGSSSQAARSGWVRRLPWHVKLLLGVLAVYLTYRAFQGIEWLVQQL